MRSLLISALLLGVVSTTAAREPCAQVAAAVKASADGTFDAEIALACLQSVPLDKQGGVSQLLGLRTMFDFQSTVAYLKDPTPGYLYPKVDLFGGIQNISDSLQSDSYANEYDFQVDISKLIGQAHDGHFYYTVDIMSVIYFQRLEGLYSISKDGISLPEVYVGADAPGLVYRNASNYTVSPVAQINGQDVETFLQDHADQSSYQDPDANYNTLFPVNNCNTGSCGNSFISGSYYMGSSTTVTFKNGSSHNIETVAYSEADWSGITDGKSFFRRFCTGKSPVAAPASSSIPISSLPASATIPPPLSTQVSYTPVPSQTTLPGPPAFPKPWVVASDYSVACYFPSEQTDLAVLAIPTFEIASQVEFSDIVRQCLATSSRLGKTRLVIDLRGNPGGYVFSGYDLFKQLFPDTIPWGAWNVRAFPLMHDIGEIVTDFYDVNPDKSSQVKTMLFNADMGEDIHLEDFDSWEDFYGPVEAHDDTFTNLGRFNLSSFAQTGLRISGYGNLTDIVPKQTFQAENIVLLQDGGCASTCTVFTEAMKTQANVRQVVVGGRKKTGPMQGVGGVKGSNIYAYDLLVQNLEFAYKHVSASQKGEMEDKYGELGPAVSQALHRAALDPTNPGGHSASVNIRNQIRKGDESITPLQFVYEAADCRIFYTAAALGDVRVLWKTAYDAYWGDGACVSGSTDQWSSEPGVGYVKAEPGASQPAASASASGGTTSTGSSPTASATGAASTLRFNWSVIAFAGLAAALMVL